MEAITYIKYWQSKHKIVLALLSSLWAEKVHVHIFRVLFPQNLYVYFPSWDFILFFYVFFFSNIWKCLLQMNLACFHVLDDY